MKHNTEAKFLIIHCLIWRKWGPAVSPKPPEAAGLLRPCQVGQERELGLGYAMGLGSYLSLEAF